MKLFHFMFVLPKIEKTTVVLIWQRMKNFDWLQGSKKMNEIKDMTNILMCAKSLFINQPMMLEINPLMMVYGDIRGQFNDLMRIN